MENVKTPLIEYLCIDDKSCCEPYVRRISDDGYSDPQALLAVTALTRKKLVLGVDLGNLMEVTSHIICPDYGFSYLSRRRIVR